ncbi:ATP-dependent helicase [Microbacterium oxydans]|nr:ATP-dependent helicase [Microbacterium oxydans]
MLDFADQVGGAYDIVESAPDVRAELREQHRVVLLDEYQDTSVIQTRFLAELFRDSAVMAVGDPHQSIYGWRGASADNLYAFSGTFSSTGAAHTYSLMTSWRNDRRILGIANRVLEPLQRPGLDVPPLEPRPGAGEGTVTVEYPFTVDEEAAAVAEWFSERRAAHDARDTAAAHATKPHTGAILFRSKRHMQTFAAALAARGSRIGSSVSADCWRRRRSSTSSRRSAWCTTPRRDRRSSDCSPGRDSAWGGRHGGALRPRAHALGA